MLLFKILQEFLLPSVFVFVFILLGLLLWEFKKRKIGKIFIIVGIVLYYIFSITPTADLILKPLEGQYNQIKNDQLNETNKIVLLLGSGESNILRASEVLRISNIKNQKPAPYRNEVLKIIISGTSFLNQETELTEEVKNYLVERGIPSEIITMEDKSKTTFESAKNIKEIVGPEPFFLVTSSYHMSRSMEVFKKMETNPIPAPTDFKRKGQYDILDFFPSAQNLRNSDLALHEYFGIVFYRLYHY